MFYPPMLEIHEAAHAVVAVRLNMSFGRIKMNRTLSNEQIIPPGITNLEGSPEEMRLAALAGCVAVGMSPQQIWSRSRLNKDPHEPVSARVLHCLESNELDKEQYNKNGNAMNTDQFEKDLSIVEKMVEDNWKQIEIIASELYSLKNQKSMSRDEVVSFIEAADNATVS